MTALAVLCAGLAAALVLPARGAARRRATPDRAVPPGPAALVAVAGVAGALPLVLDGTRLLLGLVLVAAGSGAGVLVGGQRAARAAEARRAVVVELCEALVGELRAGQPVLAGLEHCLGLWPELEPVVAAARLGADVPAALRRTARSPGAEGLREVASAWQVSQQSGAGLAAALSRVAVTARERQATRLVVRGELASAQATARLVAVLPVASLGMSAGIGGHPWHFLLDTPAGLGCLALGLACAFAGLLWIDRIAAAVLRT
jgi:tight adherence protein B